MEGRVEIIFASGYKVRNIRKELMHSPLQGGRRGNKSNKNRASGFISGFIR